MKCRRSLESIFKNKQYLGAWTPVTASNLADYINSAKTWHTYSINMVNTFAHEGTFLTCTAGSCTGRKQQITQAGFSL